MSEFGTKHNRYVNYRVALVDITIVFYPELAQLSVGAITLNVGRK